MRDFLCGAKAKPEQVDLTMINHVARYPAKVAKTIRMQMHHPIVQLGFGVDWGIGAVEVPWISRGGGVC